MKYSTLILEIIPNDEIHEDIIRKYWRLNNSEFVFSIEDLLKNTKLSKPKLESSVHKYSVVKFNAGLCNCGETVIIPVRSRSEFMNYESICKLSIVVCKNCEREERYGRMRLAITEKRWLKLRTNEIELLYKISNTSSKSEVYKYLLDRVYSGKSKKPEWELLNKFERFELIWVEREENGTSITQIHKLPELERDLHSHFNPDFDSKKSQEYPKEPEQIKLLLKRKTGRTSPKQPEFSGCFDFIKDVTLRKGVKYSYGGWKNHDGSLYIKIVPADDGSPDTREIIP